MRRLRPSLDEEVARLQSRLEKLRGVVEVFQGEGAPRARGVPVFVMYNLGPRNSRGGANGEGIFTEVDLSVASAEGPLRDTSLLHEYLHLALRPRERFLAFAATPEGKALRPALLSKAPDERGDNEAAMLNEVLVYALADVVAGSRDPQGKMLDYARSGDRQMVRTWDGVRILLPLIRGQLEKPLPSQEFLSRLIAAFLSQVHYRVWSCPSGITIAARPSAP